MTSESQLLRTPSEQDSCANEDVEAAKIARKRVHRSGLGGAIRKARREAKLSQSELASASGLHRNAVVAVEAGRGYVSTVQVLADALGLEIAGKGMPSAGNLGVRLLALRKRRRLSRRTAAKMAGISIPAIESVERTGTGHIASLEALARAVGAGLCLVPRGTSPDFWVSAGNSTGDSEWYSPAWLLDLVESVIGPFDTDPCSPGKDKSAVRANLHFTALDDGLAHDWPGAVWMNPPYGRTVGRWLKKARREVDVGNARCVVALVPARTDTAWWHGHIPGIADIVLLRGRISFGDGTAAAPFPSALLGYGLSPDQRDALFAAFPDSMHVAAPGHPDRDSRAGPGKAA